MPTGFKIVEGDVPNQPSAGNGAWTASAPRRVRQGVSLLDAELPPLPTPAGAEKKLSRGVGQSPTKSARCAGRTSLDEVQTNCDKKPDETGMKTGRNPEWSRNCSRFSVQGEHLTEAGKARYCRVGCKCWGCSGCGPRRGSMYRFRIAKHAERHQLRKLITLTLDPSKVDGADDSTRYINEIWADFRIYVKRWLGKRRFTFIRILEYQKNGYAHLHVLTNAWLNQAWVSDTWNTIGGGRIVDARLVDMDRVSHYLSKYLVKDMVKFAPPRARRVTTSRDIHLLEKEVSDYAWTMIQSPLAYLMRLCAEGGRITMVQADQDGYLVAFDAQFQPGDSP
jgi:hypothetical protein